MARFPGIDIQKDILANCEADIYFPKGRKVPQIDASMNLAFI
jgi:acyl CoA:acetate/3-ketoacid CoA transferase